MNGNTYLDACIEPWPGGYTNIHISPSERSNYGFREQALALRQKLGSGTTAVLCHGANPGLISHWVKRALLNIAHDIEGITTVPRTQDEWGQLAQKLDIKIMQCAERDTQIAVTVHYAHSPHRCHHAVDQRIQRKQFQAAG